MLRFARFERRWEEHDVQDADRRAGADGRVIPPEQRKEGGDSHGILSTGARARQVAHGQGDAQDIHHGQGDPSRGNDGQGTYVHTYTLGKQNELSTAAGKT